MGGPIYPLGGCQADFSRNWQPQGDGLLDAFHHAVINAMEVTRIQHYELGVAHVGNLAGELFCLQGLLGGFFAALLPKFSGCLPLNMWLRARLGASPY